MDEWSADFRNNWLWTDQRGLTNEELYDNNTSQQWMKAFASIHQNCISLLTISRSITEICCIPLFQDGNGWQYHVSLTIGHIHLPRIQCPSILSGQQLSWSALFQLQRRMRTESDPTVEGAPTPPRLAVSLGTLVVRNVARAGKYVLVGETVTEVTDYYVIVDVEHEDMPVWLVAPRMQLQKRLDNPFCPWNPVRHLPIFEGLLSKDDDCGYDCACILPSLRSLGRRTSDPEPPSFQVACELIRKTRTTVDPAALMLPRERALEFMDGEPLPNSFVAPLYSELGSKKDDTKANEQEGRR